MGQPLPLGVASRNIVGWRRETSSKLESAKREVPGRARRFLE